MYSVHFDRVYGTQVRLTDYLQRGDRAAEDKHGAGDKENVLEDTSEGKHETTTGADEEYGSDIKKERNERVAQQDQRSTFV